MEKSLLTTCYQTREALNPGMGRPGLYGLLGPLIMYNHLHKVISRRHKNADRLIHPTTLEGCISVNSAPIELKFEYETVLYTQNLWY
jgi:hypothetical protein